MKRFLILISLVCIFSAGCISCESKKDSKNDKNEVITEEVKKTGWNDDDVAQYAAYINKLLRKAGYTGFWWDCNDLINRNDLTCRQKIIDAIMAEYPEAEFNYEKTTTGFVEEDAFTAVHNMKTGWNLGNTLDATSYDWKKAEAGEEGWIVQYGERDSNGKVITKAFETAWGMPVTTKEIIHYVKECGFNAVRIPCTWAEHIDENNLVDKDWMARVHEVVDYVIDEGMYCILNTHHDGWVCASENMFNKYKDRFSSLWTQIANEFKDYDERLIFASMNEVTDEEDSWSPKMEVFECINKWNQLFIDTIRKQGGNHKKRNLVISPRGCSGSDRDMQILDQVTDSAENHLIIEVHNYTPQGFCFNDATWTTMTAQWIPWQHEFDLRQDFDMYARWERRIQRPVIIGEYAAFPKKYEDFYLPNN